LQQGFFTHFLLEHWRASIEEVTIMSLYDSIVRGLRGRGLPPPVTGGTLVGAPPLRPPHPADPQQRSRIYNLISSLDDEHWKALLVAVNESEETIPGPDRNSKIINLIYKMWEPSQVSTLEKAAENQSAARLATVLQRITIEPSPPSEHVIELSAELTTFITTFEAGLKNFEYTSIASWRDIIALGEQALNLEPQRAEIRTKLASAYYNCSSLFHQEGEYGQAIDYGARAISLEPENPWYYFKLGQTYQTKKDYDKAIENITIASQRDPEEPEYFYELGASYMFKGDYDQAIQNFTQALRLDDHKLVAYWRRGESYHSNGDFTQAIEDFSHAIELDPGDHLYYYLRGRSRKSLGDRRAARADFERAIKLGSEQAKAELAKL
jgi:tetratricopeptide (TPR) repeat protein